MAFNFGNWLEEAFANVNPFDGGKTASTVVAARKRKAAPAVTPAQNTTNRVGTINTLASPKQVQLNMPKISSVSTTKLMSRDEQRRKNLAEIDAIQKKAQADIWNPAKIAGDIGKSVGQVVGGAAKGVADVGTGMINDLGNRVADTGEAAATVIRQLNGENQAFDKHMQDLATNANQTDINVLKRLRTETDPMRRKQLQKVLSLDARGTALNSMQNAQQQQLQATDPRKTLVNAGNTALDVVTLGKGKAILDGVRATQKVTAPVLGQLAKNTAITGAQGAGIGATYGGVNTAIDPNASPLDYVRNMAQGAAMGAAVGVGAQIALPVAAYGAGKAARAAEAGAKATATAVENRSPKVMATQHPKYQALEQHKQMLLNQFDNAPNTMVRREISKVITDVNAQQRAIYNSELRRLSQGGYAKNPLAGEPVDPTAPQVGKTDRFEPIQVSTPFDEVPKVKLTKAERQKIDEIIYKEDPELFYQADSSLQTRTLNESKNSILPRLHVNDLKRYFGNTEEIPAKYKRKTGAEDIDQLAREAGFDNVDSFVESFQKELETRQTTRQAKQMLSELRNNPDVIKRAREEVANAAALAKDASRLQQQSKQSSTLSKGKKSQKANSQAKMAQTDLGTETRTPDTLAQTGHTSEYSTTNIDPQQYVKEMTDAQKAARKAESDKFTSKAKNTKSDFKEKFIDDLAPIEDRFRKATKGMKIPTEKNITYQLDRSRRAEGISQIYMKDNGLADVIQKVPNTKEFDQYLIAKHSKELDPTITTGRDKAKDAALVKQLDEKYKPYAQQIYKYNQKLLDSAVEYGLISKSLATSLKKQYPEYVPFNRIFNEDELVSGNFGSRSEASVSTQKAVQKLKGSERVINSPLESIIDKTRVVVEQGEKNKSAALLASYKDLPGNPFNLKEIPANETIGNRHTISFLDKGKKRTFEVDKDVAEAAKHMSREDIGLWGRIAAIPARAGRAGFTALNTAFAGANVVKDVVGAAINSEHTFRIADPRNFGMALAAALKHNGKAYSELMREGVSGTSFDMFRNPNKLNVGEIRSHKNIGTRSLYNLTHPSKYYRTLENAIGRSEDFGRALQYYSNKAGYKAKGLSEADAKRLAADQARHNATNFFRHGSAGKNINLAIPYWNAGVQGARIQTRRFIEHPVKMTAKLGFVIAAPSAMIAMNNYADPDKRKVMENIPEYEKEGNIIIVGDNAKFNDKTGRWDNVYKIPVPPQHIGIHTAIQDAVKSAVTGEPYDVMKNLGNIAENYTTINPTNPKKTISNYTPQALKLVAEPLTNTNFFTGEKIVPDSLKNLAKKDQKYKSTSGVAQVIGNALGLSPLQVDNSIKTAFGGAGQNVVNLADIGLAKAGVIKEDDIRGRDMLSSIIGRFYGAKGTSEGQIYFNTLDKAAQDNKLAGKDLAIYNSLVSTKIGSNGEIEGKTERDALNKYQNLANSRAVAKTVSDAANALGQKTGKPVDPLYKLPLDKQMQFYNIKAQNRDSQDQVDLENRAGQWYKDITKERAKYFDTVDFKADGKSQRVKYPEASPELQKVMDTYFKLPKGDAKYAFLDQHPEIVKQFERQAKYTNEVRKGQGVNELRNYPQASKRVQELMDAGSFKDAEVSKYLQDLNVYNLTKDAAQAQIKGNDLSSKALKSAQSLGKYSIVKNPDGTYSLAYNDSQGGGTNNAQDGASSGYGGYGKKGKKFSYSLDEFAPKKSESNNKQLYDLLKQARKKYSK